jgi:uncharacterized protein YneF (UPF0154 family)
MEEGDERSASVASTPRPDALARTAVDDLEGESDTRLVKAIRHVRTLSNPHLKEQCVRTEWAATETDLERDLLAEVVTDLSFWADVKQMTVADVEVLPSEDDKMDTDERLRAMFDTFDKDHSGTIDNNELHQMLLYMGVATTEAEVRDMIAQVDKNGDGDIDLPEFLEVMKGAQERNASSPLAVQKASFRSQKNANTQEEMRADQQRAADTEAAIAAAA